MKAILSIGGADSSAASGIQADVKAIAAQGAYAVTAVTAVTVQTAHEARASMALPAHIVASQLDAALEGFDVAAVKTGMLANAAVVEAVAQALRRWRPRHLVLDPVLAASSGLPLLAADAIPVLKRRLLPMANVVTPNAVEAATLTGLPVRTLDDARAAGRRLLDLGCRAVLVKGGHLEVGAGTDLLMTPDGEETIEGEFLANANNARGTGCAFAAAIATRLGNGATLAEAVRAAKTHVAGAIGSIRRIGGVIGPLDHFHAWRQGQ